MQLQSPAQTGLLFGDRPFILPQGWDWNDKLRWALIIMIGMQVDYDGAYPIEGAKEASVLLTRYVSRTLRLWQQQNQPKQLSTLAYVESQTGIHLPAVKVPQLLKSQSKAKAFLHLVVQGHGLGLQERRHPA